MTHRIHILRGLVAALALAGALPAAAGAREPDLRRPVGGLIERHAERLGLTGQPLAAVQAIVAASGERHAALLARLDAARAQMRELLSQPVPDAQAVMAQADAIGAIETDLHKNRLQAILDIRNQLTPEQRAELLRIRDEEHAKRDAEAEHGECMQDHAPGAAPSPR
jgi:Spy/CpxP family protein refolding chaperone